MTNVPGLVGIGICILSSIVIYFIAKKLYVTAREDLSIRREENIDASINDIFGLLFERYIDEKESKY